ncbi:dUTP diphosphatase [Candidatus Gracilibacteria bacterium]|nr:dUTP diphosphatase [Candidatus Gracilibacteria bacterium]
MQVQIQNSSGKLLEYKTPGACAFDFEAAEDVVFAPGEWKLVETGTVIATPEGYCLVVSPRSSIFKNYGLMQVNSIGIVDQDYCGETDTIKFPYINMRKEEVTIKKGERIGQGMFVKIEKPEFVLVDKMEGKNRGGFGTTGLK